jgi:hypothetical protein
VYHLTNIQVPRCARHTTHTSYGHTVQGRGIDDVIAVTLARASRSRDVTPRLTMSTTSTAMRAPIAARATKMTTTMRAARGASSTTRIGA